MLARCPYCQFESQPAYQHGQRRMTVCASCGAWFVWPAPAAAEVVEHYRGDVDGMPAQLREWRAGTSQSQWYRLLAKKIGRRVNHQATRIADVGAGALELTTSLATEFPSATVEAWDLFASGLPADLPDRVSAHAIDFNQVDDGSLREDTFDIVCCVAVIEHVIDPLRLVRFLRSITAPGGLTYILGPEVKSMAHRVMGRAWPYYCPDEHLTIPSLESIRRLVSMSGGGRCDLRRVNVHYSLRYLLRFLGMRALSTPFDVLLPVPSGAFELFWPR